MLLKERQHGRNPVQISFERINVYFECENSIHRHPSGAIVAGGPKEHNWYPVPCLAEYAGHFVGAPCDSQLLAGRDKRTQLTRHDYTLEIHRYLIYHISVMKGGAI
ncbi:MAG: hypothetical protein STSR0007_09150 [Thermovirga sp.]